LSRRLPSFALKSNSSKSFWAVINATRYLAMHAFIPKATQAALTAQGVQTLCTWLHEPTTENYDLLLQLADQADDVRMGMEEKLIEAFVTPFDRQELYYISVQMDRIIECAKSTLLSIVAYKVEPSDYVIKMAHFLSEGTNILAEAMISILDNKPIESRARIQEIRKAHAEVENYYRKGMADLFQKADAMEALKQHEIYSQLEDAAFYLGSTVDVFHRIVVRIV
jgi:uncharacterized protein Yka (UPF0111/DUF47 family)